MDQIARIPAGVWSGWATQSRGAGHSRHYLEFEVCDGEYGPVLIDRDREARSRIPRPLVATERGWQADVPRLWPFETTALFVLLGDTVAITLTGLGMTGREMLETTLTRGVARERRANAATAIGFSASIDDWLETHETGGSDSPMTTGVLVEQGGEALAELYRWGHAADISHVVSSCAKSVVGLLTGIALERSGRGLSAVEDPIDAFIPGDDAARWGAAGVTLRHVLTMSSGSRWIDSAEHSDSAAMLASSSPAAHGLAQPIEVAPGTRYLYDNSLPDIAATAISGLVGMPYSEFADVALFGPLGIRDYGWTPAGDDVLAAGGLHLRARDMVAIGRVALDSLGGDSRVVPSEWMQATSRSKTAPGQYAYSNFWHQNTEGCEHFAGPTAIMALGQGGQSITAVPSLDLVVVMTSLNWWNQGPRDGVFALLEEVVLPRL